MSLSGTETGAPTIVERVEEVRRRIAEACARADRMADGVTLIGASKSQPPARLLEAWQAGVRVFGENRLQEALVKIPELPPETEWHFIGPLQSNKVKKVAGRFWVVHSIDRLKIARALDREGRRRDLRIQGFCEVNLGEEASKHGFSPEALLQAAVPLADLEYLDLVGLMAVPPFESDPAAARRWFRQLRQLRDELCSSPTWSNCPGWLSMGMSQDYEIAVEEGATHVRVGSALFGPRPS